MSVILVAVLAVFSLIGAGAACRRVGWLNEQADQSLFHLTLRVLLPALIVDTCMGNEALLRFNNLVLPPLVGIGTVSLGFAVGWLWPRIVGPRSGLTEPSRQRTFSFTLGLYNYGYVPVPLVALLFPNDRETLGVLFVHNIGVEITFWSLGVLVITGGAGRLGWRHMINPPIMAIAASLLLTVLGVHHYIPQFLLTAIRMAGQCAIPLALMLIGATIADHINWSTIFTGKRVTVSACFLRLALLPAIFLLVARYLPASIELKRIIVIQAAMPSALFPILVTRHFGGDTPTALRVVLGTSLVSLATVPLWISVGFWAITSN